MAAKHYDVKNFTSAGSIGYLLKLAHALMHDRAVAGFAGHDVSFIQWLVLMKLREGTAMTASELCRKMHHDNGALTRVLDQLEERGYIERARSEEDRRVVELQLSAAGRREVASMVPQVVDCLNNGLANFSKAEFQELTRLLHKLIDSLSDNASSPAGISS
jgi:DNA-binding MarR family transcriptional regulator